VGRMFFGAAVVAFFINIGLLVFASTTLSGQEGYELQILSMINMLLLSFVLLRDTNQKTS